MRQLTAGEIETILNLAEEALSAGHQEQSKFESAIVPINIKILVCLLDHLSDKLKRVFGGMSDNNTV